MSYNNILVSIGGTPLLQSGSSVPIDTSQFLTIPKANQLYVNETGDLMKGQLNMNNNKIINVSAPTDSKDCTNKEYIDKELIRSENDLVKEIESQINKLTQQVLRYKTALENTIQTHVDALRHILDYNTSNVIKNIPAENITSGKLHKDRVPSEFLTRDNLFDPDGTFNIDSRRVINVSDPNQEKDAVNLRYLQSALTRQFGVIIEVGPCDKGYTKTIGVKIPIIPPPKNLDKKCFNLQLTPVLGTNIYADQIFMNIMNYTISVEANTRNAYIEVIILTVRMNNEGWGLHILAHLLITIYNKPQLIYKK
jgi:hypothetical protein